MIKTKRSRKPPGRKRIPSYIRNCTFVGRSTGPPWFEFVGPGGRCYVHLDGLLIISKSLVPDDMMKQLAKKTYYAERAIEQEVS